MGTRALRVFGREGKECVADLPNRETAEALTERGLQTWAWGRCQAIRLGTRFISTKLHFRTHGAHSRHVQRRCAARARCRRHFFTHWGGRHPDRACLATSSAQKYSPNPRRRPRRLRGCAAHSEGEYIRFEKEKTTGATAGASSLVVACAFLLRPLAQLRARMLHLHDSPAHDSEPAVPASGALWTTAAATVTTAKPLARRDAHGVKHL